MSNGSNTMTSQEFIKKAIAKLDEDLARYSNELGYVIYSSYKTFKKGKLYVLGMNPGGKGEEGRTIAIDLQEWEKEEELGKATCKYTDIPWSKKEDKKHYIAGQHPIQKNIISLSKVFGLAPHEVFGSNLIFRATQHQSMTDFNKEAERCWKVHALLLSVVDPDVLIVFGNGNISPYEFLREKTVGKPADNKDECKPSWCSKRTCKYFTGILCGRERVVIGFPHFSRFSVSRDGNQEVHNWIKNITRSS